MKSCVPSFKNYKSKFPEFEENINCVENYLNLYEWFAQDPTNKNITREIYNETLKMLERSIDTRLMQGDIASQQATKFSRELAEKYPDVFSVEDGKLKRDFSNYELVSPDDKGLAAWIIILQDAVTDVMSNTAGFLKDMLDECKKPDTSEVVCIEKFVNASHVKGPYIPLGCGLPYPEFEGHIDDDREEPINVVGRLMAQETRDALDCLHNR